MDHLKVCLMANKMVLMKGLHLVHLMVMTMHWELKALSILMDYHWADLMADMKVIVMECLKDFHSQSSLEIY